ncbi:MAG: sterol desaturase family protein [Parvularculaceae bacterium]|nr:sterol desaturase family protein [Parvularculaceae bacterium]
MRIFVGYKAWKEEGFLLNRMTFDDLVRAYLTYPAMQIYFAMIAVAIIVSIATLSNLAGTFAALIAGGLIFPIAWYVTHRFILHGSWMYKTRFLARFWKRTHYDHHRFPNDLSVLFGGLQTTVPPILLVAGPVGYAIAGASGAAASIAGMVIMTCYTEFLHAGQHLAFEPKSGFWKTIKERHLAHHFHNENGNFGIAEFFWDKVFRTFYAGKADRPRSATARNLGYTDEMAKKYPWVKEVTDQEPESQRKFRSAA